MKISKRFVTIILTIIFMIIINHIYKFIPNVLEKEDTPEKEVFLEGEKLIDILKKSDYFQSSNFKYDGEKKALMIDSKYEVYIKNNHYLMNIKDSNENMTYCNIVDAVEQSLGLEKGASIKTCEYTLDGKIGLDYIKATVYDSYKVLTVNYENPTTIYNEENQREEKELISVDEINYTINIDNYIFTSMFKKYDIENNVFLVCGHIWNNKENHEIFKVKLYDINKTYTASADLVYEDDTENYTNVCSKFEGDYSMIKYYSIERQSGN